MKPPAARPRLLVSCRNAAEARAALAAGATLIDVKEPSRGALGAADPQVIAEVVASVGRRVMVSAALGELAQHPLCPSLLPPGVQLAKLGLAGSGTANTWVARWREVAARLPRSTRLVAVAYADWRSALAPTPEAVLEAAEEAGCAALLVDTFDKSRGHLLAHWPAHNLASFVERVRAAGLLAVLAGSLSTDQVPLVATLGPDYVAVRGAACTGGRAGRISARRVASLVHLLQDATLAPPTPRSEHALRSARR